MSSETPRDAAQRVKDALAHLSGDEDLWISTASDGQPWLVPLSFHWTGNEILLATTRNGRTFRNLLAGGGARIALGPTRDVVMLDGDVDLPDELDPATAAIVAETTGMDPRNDPDAGYVRFVPRRAHAWRTVQELKERTIMRDGTWLAG